MTEQTQQSKTITWVDPLPQAALARTMSGLDYLQAIIDGDIPGAPIASHINMEFVSVEAGTAVMAATPDESHYNPIGSVHGGFFATVLDSVCGCAVHSTLPAGVGYTTLELKVSFLRPVTAETGTVTAHGWVTKGGRNAAFVEADLQFHSELARSINNTVLLELLQSIRSLLRVWVDRAVQQPEEAAAAIQEHAAVYAAIATRDPDSAASAMAVHMNTAGARLSRSMTP